MVRLPGGARRQGVAISGRGGKKKQARHLSEPGID